MLQVSKIELYKVIGALASGIEVQMPDISNYNNMLMWKLGADVIGIEKHTIIKCQRVIKNYYVNEIHPVFDDIHVLKSLTKGSLERKQTELLEKCKECEESKSDMCKYCGYAHYLQHINTLLNKRQIISD